jgi:hypothetical protein
MKNFFYANRDAPILDAYIGLLEAPKLVLYLGLKDQAMEKIKSRCPGVHRIVTQRQFQRDGLAQYYYERMEVIE